MSLALGEPSPRRSGNVYVVETDAQGTAELPFEDRQRGAPPARPPRAGGAALVSPPPYSL